MFWDELKQMIPKSRKTRTSVISQPQYAIGPGGTFSTLSKSANHTQSEKIPAHSLDTEDDYGSSMTLSNNYSRRHEPMSGEKKRSSKHRYATLYLDDERSLSSSRKGANISSSILTFPNGTVEQRDTFSFEAPEAHGYSRSSRQSQGSLQYDVYPPFRKIKSTFGGDFLLASAPPGRHVYNQEEQSTISQPGAANPSEQVYKRVFRERMSIPMTYFI